MTQILIDSDNIKRNLFLDFDVDFDITYEQFANESRFDEIREFIRKDSRFEMPFSNDFNAEYVVDNIGQKAMILLNYDVIENYIWLSKYIFDIASGFVFDDSKKYINSILNKKDWFYDWEINDLLNCVKSKITKNQFLLKKNYVSKYKKNISYKWCIPDIKIMDKNYLKIMNIWGNKTYQTIKDKISYDEKIVTNCRMEYIILLSFLMDEVLYLISNSRLCNMTLVSESNLFKYLEGLSVVENISSILVWTNPQHNKLLEDIRYKYNSQWSSLKTVFADIKNFIKKVWNAEINLSFQDEKPMYMKGKFKNDDMNKYWELKEYTSDYGYVAHKNHKWSKKTIVGEKEFKYKKDWNTTKNK